jgi:hypothetical protein
MIIGQPKRLEDYAVLTPQEFEALRQQLDPGIAQGAPPETPVALDFGTVCRLAATIGHFAVLNRELVQKLQPASETPSELPPLPVLRAGE